MSSDPFIPGKAPLQIALGLLGAFTRAEAPSLSTSVDVGVHRECRNSECLRHYDRCCLVADAHQRFERFETARHFGLVMRDEIARQIHDSLSFCIAKATGADDFLDGLDAERCHFARCASECEKLWRHEVNACIGALCGQQDSDQQRVGVAVRQWNAWIGEVLVENFTDQLCAFHLPKQNCEKMFVKMSSVTLVPMIVPSSLSAVRISAATNSAETRRRKPSMTALTA